MDLQVLSLPRPRKYEEVQALQKRLVEQRRLGEIPDTIVFCEHEPVITRGRGLQWVGDPDRPRQMPLPKTLPKGVSFCESERGGDLTFHGPGQLVVYPILKLEGTHGLAPKRDVVGYLRLLEQWGMELLKSYGLQGFQKPNASGIWVHAHQRTRKIASIGIAVRHWITYHGMAINAVNELEPFQAISPCGFDPNVMTRLKNLTELSFDWREEIEERLIERIRLRRSSPKRKITESELGI